MLIKWICFLLKKKKSSPHLIDSSEGAAVEINSGSEMAFPCYETSELLESLGLSTKKEKVGGSPEQIPDGKAEEQENLQTIKVYKAPFL